MFFQSIEPTAPKSANAYVFLKDGRQMFPHQLKKKKKKAEEKQLVSCSLRLQLVKALSSLLKEIFKTLN